MSSRASRNSGTSRICSLRSRWPAVRCRRIRGITCLLNPTDTDYTAHRKPDPRFFQVVLDRLGVEAEETIFLDDIPHNLAAAAKMGFKTIRASPFSAPRPFRSTLTLPFRCHPGVRHGRSQEAVQELEKTLDMDLTAPLSKL